MLRRMTLDRWSEATIFAGGRNGSPRRSVKSQSHNGCRKTGPIEAALVTTNQTGGSQFEILDKGVPLTRGEMKKLNGVEAELDTYPPNAQTVRRHRPALGDSVLGDDFCHAGR